MDAAWPALERHHAGGWIFRAAAGVTQRANSIWPRNTAHTIRVKTFPHCSARRGPGTEAAGCRSSSNCSRTRKLRHCMDCSTPRVSPASPRPWS
ncbi:GNAT family N-acetyltransferase, cg3035/Rv0428c family [Pseudarthrobacter defluvii]|uniref:GNAT family N-acetyltransferase, cg3035/Rv0428c family n=1 Tax=Pseudarthrobacter defluvii TaxID=410837 RepID=UPI003DA8C571